MWALPLFPFLFENTFLYQTVFGLIKEKVGSRVEWRDPKSLNYDKSVGYVSDYVFDYVSDCSMRDLTFSFGPTIVRVEFSAVSLVFENSVCRRLEQSPPKKVDKEARLSIRKVIQPIGALLGSNCLENVKVHKTMIRVDA